MRKEQKNLFDYATKELSQDAFLRWLFESYKDEDVKPCVRKLLKEFCGVDESAEITELETRAQWAKIDIEVKFTANGVKHALYIEDKTFSEAHDQLKKYNDAIDKHQKAIKVSKVFYKTYLISEKDKKETEKDGWITYDINTIYDLFESFSSSSNIILRQYIEHLSKIHKALHNKEKPLDNEPNNYLNWEGYFSEISKDIIKEHCYQNSGAWKAGPYPYICLVLRKSRFVPYLEVRSKDCLENKFEALILCYGLDDKKENSPYSAEEINQRQQKLIEKINKSDSIFVPKHTLNNFNGYKKQLGRYKSEKSIENDDEFINELEKCAKYYDELIALWDEKQFN